MIGIKHRRREWLSHFCRGELPAYLDCRFNLVDARDVAQGMVRAMERGRPGIQYVLGGANHHALHEWLQILGRAADARRPVGKFRSVLRSPWGG